MQLHNANESLFHVLSKAETYRACPHVSSLYLMNGNWWNSLQRPFT